MKAGIVGLPNVGKSTLFNCLSNVKAQSANFPFCTIEPNIGIINVPDKRLSILDDIVNPEKIIPRKPTYGVNYSGRTKQCSKGCGAEIYWDEEFKSDSGKFIPLDARTDEPHSCNGPER